MKHVLLLFALLTVLSGCVVNAGHHQLPTRAQRRHHAQIERKYRNFYRHQPRRCTW